MQGLDLDLGAISILFGIGGTIFGAGVSLGLANKRIEAAEQSAARANESAAKANSTSTEMVGGVVRRLDDLFSRFELYEASTTQRIMTLEESLRSLDKRTADRIRKIAGSLGRTRDALVKLVMWLKMRPHGEELSGVPAEVLNDISDVLEAPEVRGVELTS